MTTLFLLTTTALLIAAAMCVRVGAKQRGTPAVARVANKSRYAIFPRRH